MNLLKKLWSDEAGVILSAEAAVIGTVAIVGISAGLSVTAKAVNEELKEVGFAIRSLDQSYSIPAQKGCNGAFTAGSSFTQAPVKESLAELKEVADEAERQEAAQAERLKQQLEQQNSKTPDKKKKKKKDQASL